MKKVYPVVKVEWIDAEADNSWRDEAEVNKDGVGIPVVTIGFLVRKPSKKFPMYVVASTLATTDDGEHHFNSIMKIPKAWVKTVEEIKKNEAV